MKRDLLVDLPRFEFRFRLSSTRNTWSAAVLLLSPGFPLELLFLSVFCSISRPKTEFRTSLGLTFHLLWHLKVPLEANIVFPLQRYVSHVGILRCVVSQ